MQETVELVDIVDETDNVIGQATKHECVGKGLAHRASIILIFRGKMHNEMLIQKRSKFIEFPLKYAFTAGHVKSGETYGQCALRELKEELFKGLAVPSKIALQPLFRTKDIYDGHDEFRQVFSTVWPGPFYNDRREVESVSFVEIRRLNEDMQKQPDKYTEMTRGILRKYLAFTQGKH